MSARPSAGFTLVELVAVIVVLGILALGTVSFLGDTSRGFGSAVTRAELAGSARQLVERIAGDLRNALPGSVRASGACVEFLPVVAASRYVTLPVATSAPSFEAVPIEPMPVPVGVRAAVFPDASAYTLASPGAVSPTVTVSAPGPGNTVTVTFAAPHRFPSESPHRRFFLVRDPVSYCVSGDRLYRYRDYGFRAAQPGPADLPGGLPDRVLVAGDVASAAPFAISGATLARNAVVALDLALARDGDTVRVDHLVQVRNVP